MSDELEEEYEEETEEATDAPDTSLRDSLEDAIDEHELSEDTDSSEDEGIEDVPSDEEEAIEYPSAWKPEIREQMKEMPKEFQKWASDFTASQQATFTRNMQELARVRKNNEGVVQTLQPYMESIQEAGETPEQRIGYLLEVDRALFEGDPSEARATLLQLCQDAEINPAELLQQNGYAQPQGMPGAYVDPRVGQLEQEINRLRQEAGQHKKYFESEQQRRQQEVVQSVNSTIQDFAQAKDEEGQLLRPYFNDLQDEMAVIASGIKAQQPNMPHAEVLDRAYNVALSSNPNLQERIQKDRAKNDQLAKARQAKAKASKARKAGSSVSGSPGSSSKSQAPDTIRDALHAAMGI